MLLSFNDICLVPSIVSDIEHRSECSPYLDNDMLPLFTAPMTSVIDENNWKIFKENKINTIIPRSVDINIRLELTKHTFIAVSLSEFEEYFINNWLFSSCTQFVCVDIANGHMKKLLDLCRQAKEKYGSSLQIMTGNIANPDTYLEYAKVGIDYVRCGIGTSPVCLTSANNGIHYPMVSLLQNITNCKQNVKAWLNHPESNFKSVPKIVADGGFNNFDQIIKALAIGADYVMLGKIFAMSEEACGEVVYKEQFIPTKLDLSTLPEDDRKLYEESGLDEAYITKTIKTPFRKYYGMSTKKAQAEFGNETLKTAEGIETLVPIKYTLTGWSDNFISYLRSAMSYCNSRTLNEFKQNAHVEQISANSFQAYYK